MKNTLESLGKYTEENVDHIIHKDEKQRMAGMFLIKKTALSEELVNKWYNLMCNYHNIDDSKSVNGNYSSFKEHRHDQPIYSVLTKMYNMIYVDDNYDDKCKLNSGDVQPPFLPCRMR